MSKETIRKKIKVIAEGMAGLVVLFFALPQIFGWIAIRIMGSKIPADNSLMENFAIREIVGIVILLVLGVMLALIGDD